ncbi:hypothetical protein [Vibrio alginolyticus]|uniref:hypothetical protein n=1 Tax=Vibrio alginolyticus TaxID=663 RepID=UPI002FEFF26A|nr:hypothetical protein [Vibrio parahaemolyticus]
MTKATTHRLKLSKPTKDDFKAFWAMYGHAQHIHGAVEFSERIEDFSESEARHLKALSGHFLRSGDAVSRIVMAAETLMSEQNGLIDQSSDVLEFNPELVRRLEAIDHTIGWVQSVNGDMESIRMLWDTVPEHNKPAIDRIRRALRLLELVESDNAKVFELLKNPLRGEQSITVQQRCSACAYDMPDEECEVCGGEIEFETHHTIPWTEQKETLSMAFKVLLSEVES